MGSLLERGRQRSARGPNKKRRKDRATGDIPKLLSEHRGIIAVAIYLFLAMILGGGAANWHLAYLILAVATLGFAVFTALNGNFASLGRISIFAKVGLLGTILLPLLQLVPLPPAVWHALPGQTLRIALLDLVGAGNSWQPLTLDPLSTSNAAVLAIGFVMLTLALIQLNNTDFRRAVNIAFAIMLLGIGLGVLQVTGGERFPKMFSNNNIGTMLGFYANKNHMALALSLSIIIFGFIVAKNFRDPARRRLFTISYIIFTLVCIVTTNSRAGIGLGLIATFIVLFPITRSIKSIYILIGLAILFLLSIPVFYSSAFQEVFTRVGDISSDLRWKLLFWSAPLVNRYFVLGSGIGSFSDVFQIHEHLDWVKPTYVNAVHNDYVQLVLEGGLPSVFVLFMLVSAVIGRIWDFTYLTVNSTRRAEMAAGFSIILLCMAHSLIDYPLRRPAVWVFLAIGLAALFRQGGSSHETVSKRRGTS